jgi:hypothetical protein
MLFLILFVTSCTETPSESDITVQDNIPVAVKEPVPVTCASLPCKYDGKAMKTWNRNIDVPPFNTSWGYPYTFRLDQPTRVEMDLNAFVWPGEVGSTNNMYIAVDYEEVYSEPSGEFLEELGGYNESNDRRVVQLGLVGAGDHILEIYAEPYREHFFVDWFELRESR